MVFNISINSVISSCVLKLTAGNNKGFSKVFSWLNKRSIIVDPCTTFRFWQLASFNDLNPSRSITHNFFNPLKVNPTKWSNILMNVFDHFIDYFRKEFFHLRKSQKSSLPLLLLFFETFFYITFSYFAPFLFPWNTPCNQRPYCATVSAAFTIC